MNPTRRRFLQSVSLLAGAPTLAHAQKRSPDATDNSTSHLPTFKSGRLISAVFAYLDTVLAPELVEAAKGFSPNESRHSEGWWGSSRQTVSTLINHTFRLQAAECPLRHELAEYRLYYREDMADTLALAYGLFKTGNDPSIAFARSYDFGEYGFLTWEDVGELRKGEDGSRSHRVWNQLNYHYEPGDRIASFEKSSMDTSYMVVRGHQVAWIQKSNIHVHYTRAHPDFKGDALRDHWLKLGGCPSYVRNDFVWPPENWENPVTDEVEREMIAAWKNRPRTSSEKFLDQMFYGRDI